METSEIYKILSESEISVSTDTRTVKIGDVYIGLKGETFDGNAFAQQALDKGARLAIVEGSIYANTEGCIVVSNTHTTLRELARIHRASFSMPLLAIGGSNGKTTTKELATAVLSTTYRVHTTKGNLNNDIGVPLTILGMPRDTEIAIIEIGANHADEHAMLMDIVLPTHVLVTNNGADHLEGFGSLDGVRNANKEIYDCARRHNAIAFVNKDLADLVADSADMNRIVYPEQPVESISNLYAGVNYDGTAITSQLFGSFNEPNILAAIAVGTYFKVPLPAIAKAIGDYQPTLKRSQVVTKDDYTMIVDCYNANPTSMELALKDFFASTIAGKRVIVIGDMLEVGETELQAHKAILDMIQTQSDADDVVICVGPRLAATKEGFPFHFYLTAQDAKTFFTTLDLSGKIIFLKASRGIRLEDILQ